MMTYKEKNRTYQEGKPEEPVREDEVDVTRDLTAAVNREVRRVFRKTGLILGMILLVILLLIWFVLPQAVSHFYYDPSKKVGKDMNQMSLDMSIYSELLMPFHIVDHVTAEANGYGKYDVTLWQTTYEDGVRPVRVSGVLTRNQLKLYQPDALAVGYGNAFEWASADRDPSKTLQQQIGTGERELTKAESEASGGAAAESTVSSFAGTRSASRKKIRALPDGEMKYMAFLNPERILSFSQAQKLADGRKAWYAVWRGTGETFRGYGFTDGATGIYEGAFYDTSVHPSKYPLLTFGQIRKEMDQSGGTLSEKDWQNHFLSLLHYTEDQETLRKMLGHTTASGDDASYRSYIRKHGLRIYGVVLMLTKQEMLSMMKDPGIYSIGVYEQE